MQPYQAIIVDDEKIIREWLSVRVPWQDLGFEVVGQFKNGKEALSFMKTNHVDLVLSDLKMPVMDGMHLIQTIRAQKFDCKIILISGFDDFAYAKMAIQNGVSDYLLKPVELKEITDSVKKVRQQLEEEQSTAKTFFEQNAYMLREFMKLAQDGNFEPALSAQALSRLLGVDSYFFLRISPDYENTDNDTCRIEFRQKGQVYERCLQALKKQYRLCELFSKEDILVLALGDKQVREDLIEAIVAELSQQEIAVSVGASDVHDDPHRFVDALVQANQVNIFQFYNGSRVVFRYEKDYFELKDNLEAISQLQFFEDELYHLVSKEDVSGTDVIANELNRYLYRLRYFKIGAVSNYYLQLLERLTVKVAGGEFIEEKYFKKLEAVKQQLKQTRYLTDMNTAFIKAINILSLICHDLKHKKRVDIDDILAYIGNNLATINLNIVASYCCLTPKYFSKLFKERFGFNFVEYLTEQRIQKALELLRGSTLTVTEISAQLGYGDEKYFSKLFKRQTGFTPSQYRESTTKAAPSDEV